MILFGLGLLCVLAAVVMFFVRWSDYRGNVSVIPRLWLLIPLGIAAVLVTLSFITTIGAKSVGVVTSFGKVASEPLDAGLHFKAPWHKVTELDGTTQTDEYAGNSCIPVRIADGGVGCVSLTNRWAIRLEQANSLYTEYRSDDINESIATALVDTQLRSVVAGVFSEFNPLLATQQGDVSQTADVSPDLNQFSDEITTAMQARLEELGGGQPQVDVRAITVSFLDLPQATEAKIAQLQEEVANTRIAQQRQATSTAQAAANRQLEGSVTTEVLVSRCIDWLEETNKAIPAGFSCWPGGGGGVVLPSAR